jgi:hypothetical protein
MFIYVGGYGAGRIYLLITSCELIIYYAKDVFYSLETTAPVAGAEQETIIKLKGLYFL